MAQGPAKLPIKVAIKDRTLLYHSYMRFLKMGGIFISTNTQYKLGENQMIILDIMEAEKPFPMMCKAVWFNPKSTSTVKPTGVGFAFPADEIGKQAKEFIEKNLLGLLDNPRPTFTM